MIESKQISQENINQFMAEGWRLIEIMPSKGLALMQREFHCCEGEQETNNGKEK